MLTLGLDAAVLPKALYLAYISALLVKSADPWRVPCHTEWEALDDATRALWQETAHRLLAVHGEGG